MSDLALRNPLIIKVFSEFFYLFSVHGMVD